MHIDSVMISIIAAFVIIFFVGIIMRYLKQPYVMAYIISGIILGPDVSGLITNPIAIGRFSDFGVIILLFFLGMELSLKELSKCWKTALIIVLGQILLSFMLIMAIGTAFDWPLSRCLLISYVISLSSTAVIIKILQEWNEINTEAGKNIVAILIMQDILLAPMLVTCNIAGGIGADNTMLLFQLIGTLIIGLIIRHILKYEQIKLPLASLLKRDHELQTFSSFCICFGAALLTHLIDLSSGLGAFIGGMIVSSAKETDWIQHRLESLKILFIALFFVSVGMMLDLKFVATNIYTLILLIIVILVSKSITMSALLRILGYGWLTSLYAGAMLSQIGEFSFVLAATGKKINIVSEYAYQMTIALITMSLLVSPLWIYVIKKFTTRKVMLTKVC